MALDTDNILTSILTILKNNTATIAASLTSASAIGTIRSSNAPIPINQYPAIIVRLPEKTEEFNVIGQRNNYHESLFEIIPIMNYNIGASESDQEVRKLVRGTKQVLKDNITLSNTVYWSIPEITEYHSIEYDGIFCSAAKIMFRTFNWSI